jgi:molecular chaperone HscB
MAVPLFCDHCGYSYPERRGMSAFAILSLPASFALSQEQIERRELELTRRLHPDRWQQEDSRLHRHALIAQVAVNEALEAIREPIQRGETLLALQAAELSEQLQAEQRPDQSFLLEQLELQEEVRNTLEPARKRDLKRRIRSELAGLTEQLSVCFSDFEAENEAENRRKVVGQTLRFLGEARYWRNLQRTLRGEAPR